MKPSSSTGFRSEAAPRISPAIPPISKPPTFIRTSMASSGSGRVTASAFSTTATFNERPPAPIPVPRPAPPAAAAPATPPQCSAPRPAVDEVPYHLQGHFLRNVAHDFGRDAVIAGHDHHSPALH